MVQSIFCVCVCTYIYSIYSTYNIYAYILHTSVLLYVLCMYVHVCTICTIYACMFMYYICMYIICTIYAIHVCTCMYYICMYVYALYMHIYYMYYICYICMYMYAWLHACEKLLCIFLHTHDRHRHKTCTCVN
jgi:hypothetical protein